MSLCLGTRIPHHYQQPMCLNRAKKDLGREKDTGQLRGMVLTMAALAKLPREMSATRSVASWLKSAGWKAVWA